MVLDSKIEFDTSGREPLAALRLGNSVGTTFDLYLGPSSDEWSALCPEWSYWCMLEDSNWELALEDAARMCLGDATRQNTRRFTDTTIHKGIRARINPGRIRISPAPGQFYRGMHELYPSRAKIFYPPHIRAAEMPDNGPDSGLTPYKEWYEALYQSCTSESTWDCALGRLPGIRQVRSHPPATIRVPPHYELMKMGDTHDRQEITITGGLQDDAEENTLHRYFSRLLVKACVGNNTAVISGIMASSFNKISMEAVTSSS
ncbi:hypothetical protein PG991_006644 [Apiospora marii]|uniref:Uncharacterized protein n=2 Tax=Apiospora marii TaxID=335849 RepID=A0ABR1S160_9PEZI